MGTRMAPSYANLFMGKLEQRVFQAVRLLLPLDGMLVHYMVTPSRMSPVSSY